jgi:hypothetical protein
MHLTNLPFVFSAATTAAALAHQTSTIDLGNQNTFLEIALACSSNTGSSAGWHDVTRIQWSLLCI